MPGVMAPAARVARAARRVLTLGAVVALTFAVLWGPFCLFSSPPLEGEDGGVCLSSLTQVRSGPSRVVLFDRIEEGGAVEGMGA